MLDLLTSEMHKSFDPDSPGPTFVVVSCLDVASIFDSVSRQSKRPLFPMRLQLCSAEDTKPFFKYATKLLENDIQLNVVSGEGDPRIPLPSLCIVL
jgi:hypothetical protein